MPHGQLFAVTWLCCSGRAPSVVALFCILLASLRARADHYSTLGVSRHASPEEVRRQYRAAALRYHPDRHVADTPARRAAAEARFKEVSAAYETLSVERRRAEYDTARERAEHAASHTRAEYDEARFSPARSQGLRRAALRVVVVRCSLREVFEGACKYRRVPGLIDLNVFLRPEWQSGHSFETMSSDGRAVRVLILVRPHPVLARRGSSLFCSRLVTRAGAARGVPLNVRALDGRMLRFRPAPGRVWSDGQRVAWRGAGMWAADGSRGDVVLTVRIAAWPAVLAARIARVCCSMVFLRAVQALVLLANVELALTVVASSLRALAAHTGVVRGRARRRRSAPSARRGGPADRKASAWQDLASASW